MRGDVCGFVICSEKFDLTGGTPFPLSNKLYHNCCYVSKGILIKKTVGILVEYSVLLNLYETTKI